MTIKSRIKFLLSVMSFNQNFLMTKIAYDKREKTLEFLKEELNLIYPDLEIDDPLNFIKEMDLLSPKNALAFESMFPTMYGGSPAENDLKDDPEISAKIKEWHNIRKTNPNYFKKIWLTYNRDQEEVPEDVMDLEGEASRRAEKDAEYDKRYLAEQDEYYSEKEDFSLENFFNQKDKTGTASKKDQNWKPLDWLAEADAILKIAEKDKATYSTEGKITIPGISSSNTLLKLARERLRLCTEQFLNLPAPDKILYNLLGIIYVLGEENRGIFGGSAMWQKYHNLSIGMKNSQLNYENFMLDLNLSDDQKIILRFLKSRASKKGLDFSARDLTEKSVSLSPGKISDTIPGSWSISSDSWMPSDQRTNVDPSLVLSFFRRKGMTETAEAIDLELNRINDPVQENLFLNKLIAAQPELEKLSDLEAREKILQYK